MIEQFIGQEYKILNVLAVQSADQILNLGS
jgi:hypothetical protein